MDSAESEARRKGEEVLKIQFTSLKGKTTEARAEQFRRLVVLIDPILAELFAGCVRHPLSSSAEDGGGRAKICFEAICPLTGDRSVLGLKDMKQHIANHAVEVLCAAIGAQAAPEEAIMEVPKLPQDMLAARSRAAVALMSPAQKTVVAEITNLLQRATDATRRKGGLLLDELVLALKELLGQLLTSGDGLVVGVVGDTGKGKTYLLDTLLFGTLDPYAYLKDPTPQPYLQCLPALDNIRRALLQAQPDSTLVDTMTYAELLTHAHHVVMPADYGGPSELPALKEQLERFDHTLALYCTDSHAIEKRRTVLTSQNAGGRPSSNAVLTALYWVHMYMHAKFSTLHALCQKCEPFLHHLKEHFDELVQTEYRQVRRRTGGAGPSSASGAPRTLSADDMKAARDRVKAVMSTPKEIKSVIDKVDPERSPSAHYYKYAVGYKVAFCMGSEGWEVDTHPQALDWKPLVRALAGAKKDLIIHGPTKSSSAAGSGSAGGAHTDVQEQMLRLKLFFADVNDFLQGRADVEPGLLERLLPVLPVELRGVTGRDESETLVVCIEELHFGMPSGMLANCITVKDYHGSNATLAIHKAQLEHAVREEMNRAILPLSDKVVEGPLLMLQRLYLPKVLRDRFTRLMQQPSAGNIDIAAQYPLIKKALDLDAAQQRVQSLQQVQPMEIDTPRSEVSTPRAAAGRTGASQADASGAGAGPSSLGWQGSLTSPASTARAAGQPVLQGRQRTHPHTVMHIHNPEYMARLLGGRTCRPDLPTAMAHLDDMKKLDADCRANLRESYLTYLKTAYHDYSKALRRLLPEEEQDDFADDWAFLEEALLLELEPPSLTVYPALAASMAVRVPGDDSVGQRYVSQLRQQPPPDALHSVDDVLRYTSLAPVLSAICGEAAVDTVATLAGLMEFIDRAISDVTVPTQTRSLFKQQLTAAFKECAQSNPKKHTRHVDTWAVWNDATAGRGLLQDACSTIYSMCVDDEAADRSILAQFRAFCDERLMVDEQALVARVRSAVVAAVSEPAAPSDSGTQLLPMTDVYRILHRDCVHTEPLPLLSLLMDELMVEPTVNHIYNFVECISSRLLIMLQNKSSELTKAVASAINAVLEAKLWGPGGMPADAPEDAKQRVASCLKRAEQSVRQNLAAVVQGKLFVLGGTGDGLKPNHLKKILKDTLHRHLEEAVGQAAEGLAGLEAARKKRGGAASAASTRLTPVLVADVVSELVKDAMTEYSAGVKGRLVSMVRTALLAVHDELSIGHALRPRQSQRRGKSACQFTVFHEYRKALQLLQLFLATPQQLRGVKLALEEARAQVQRSHDKLKAAAEAGVGAGAGGAASMDMLPVIRSAGTGRRLPDDADVATEWNALALEVDDLPVQWTRGAPFSAVLTGVPPREALDPAHRLLDDVLRLHDAVPAGNRAGMYTLECAVYQAKRQSTELPNKQQVLELRLRAMQCLTAACAEDRKLEDGRSLRDVVNTYLDDAGLTLADWTDPERWAMEAEASAPGDALLLQGLAILEEATFCVWVPAINEKNKEEALPPSVLKFQPLAADAADADLVERADSNAYWLSHVSHLGSGDANIYRAHLFMSDDALAELAESAEELMALADEAAPAADAANAGAPGLGGAGDGGDDDDSGDVARPELPAALDAQLPEGEAVDEVSSLAGWSSGLSGASAGPSVLPTKPPVSPPPATDLAPGGGAPPTFEFGPPAPSTAQLTLVLDRSLEQEAPALLAQLAEHMPLGLSGGCRCVVLYTRVEQPTLSAAAQRVVALAGAAGTWDFQSSRSKARWGTLGVPAASQALLEGVNFAREIIRHQCPSTVLLVRNAPAAGSLRSSEAPAGFDLVTREARSKSQLVVPVVTTTQLLALLQSTGLGKEGLLLSEEFLSQRVRCRGTAACIFDYALRFKA